MMRKVTVQKKTTLPVDIIWKTFTDIANYPKTVTFVKSVIINEPIKKSTKWQDITTILWIPLKMPHIVTEIEENKNLRYDVKLPLGGHMQQVYHIAPKKNYTDITGSVVFDLGNPVANFLIGPILEKRLKYMLLSSFGRIG